MSTQGPQGDRTRGDFGRTTALDAPRRPDVAVGQGGNEDFLVRENAILKEENKSLQEQVRRCQAEMKIYQTKYPGLRMPALTDLDLGDELPPWISQSRFMSPLLVAYEKRIQDLTKRNLEQQKELGGLRLETKKNLLRNEQLERDLQKHVGSVVQQFDGKQATRGSGSSGSSGSASSSGIVSGGDGRELIASAVPEEIKELQEHVALLREEGDLLRSQDDENQAHIVQLVNQIQEERNEKELLESKLEDMNRLALSKDKMQVNLQQTMGSLSIVAKDKDRLLEQLKVTKVDLKTAIVKHQQYRKQQEQVSAALKEDVMRLREELSSYGQREIEGQARIDTLEKQLETVNDKLRHAVREQDTASNDVESMVKALEQLEQTLAGYKQRESKAMKRESELVEATHNAELARDQISAKEQGLRDEIKRLQGGMETHAAEVKKASDANVTKIYTKAKETEAKLLEQLRNMQLACAELDAAREKAARGLHSTEKQLKALQAKSQAEITRLSDALHKLRTTLADHKSETERYQDKATRASTELRVNADAWGKEREVLSTQCTKERQLVDEREFQLKAALQENARLADMRAALELEIRQLQTTFESRQNAYAGDVERLKASKHEELGQMHHRLGEAYQMQEESESRLAGIIANKEESAKRWKEENKETLQNFQRVVKEQKEHVERNRSLTRKLAGSTRECAAVKQNQEENEKLVAHLRNEVQTHKEKVKPLSVQLNETLQREKEALQGHVTLKSQLERMQLEQERSLRQHTNQMRKQQFNEQANTLSSRSVNVL
jgi:hypothetical protein